jgi:hypothetical protein
MVSVFAKPVIASHTKKKRGLSLSNEAEWVRASTVYRVLLATGENPFLVENRIAAYLRNGDLKARAKYIWVSDERYTSAAWRSRPEDAEGGDVPTSIWRLEKNIAEDRSQWRLVVSALLMTKTIKPRRRVMMRGVEFLLSDLQNLLPKSFAKGVPAEKFPGKKYRPGDEEVYGVYRRAAEKGRLGDLIGMSTDAHGANTELRNMIIDDHWDGDVESAPVSTLYRKIADIIELDIKQKAKPDASLP